MRYCCHDNSYLCKIQVGVGRDHTLFALVEGKVQIKRELLEPYPWALGEKKDPFMRESFSVFREEQRTSKTCASAELLVLADHTL